MSKSDQSELKELKKTLALTREIIDSLHSVLGLLTRELKTAKATIKDLQRYSDKLLEQVRKYEALP